jgi:hypothetical protein
MNWIPQEHGADSFVLSLGSEEASILLQPREMFRRVLDSRRILAENAQFLTPQNAGAGMLAVLPRQAVIAWLDETATHPVERDFQELLIQHATVAELPSL